MSNILSILFGPKKNVPEETPPRVPEGKKIKENSKEKGTYLTEFAFNAKWQIMEERMQNSNLIITVAIGALFICFLALFYGYWQFAASSFNDYSARVKELNDGRLQELNLRVSQLEIGGVASSPTPVKVVPKVGP